MGFTLVMGTILVALTHALRVLGQLAGPRWGGLALGLPCTTALILIGSGIERGAGYATGMAESSMTGLAAAVVLPLAYALAVGSGWCWPSAMATAVAGYLAVAWYVHSLAIGGAAVRLVVVACAVLLGGCLAAQLRITPGKSRGIAVATPSALLLRTLVPVSCLGTVLALRDSVGVGWAGLLSTFPGLTLTLLIVTHVEAGPTEVRRLARALPPGNWSMVAFLAAFRFGCPVLGLAASIACGYGAALTALLVVERLTRAIEPCERGRERGGRPERRTGRAGGTVVRDGPFQRRRAGICRPRGFSPRIEAIC